MGVRWAAAAEEESSRRLAWECIGELMDLSKSRGDKAIDEMMVESDPLNRKGRPRRDSQQAISQPRPSPPTSLSLSFSSHVWLRTSGRSSSVVRTSSHFLGRSLFDRS
jgi:hypothetical protein